MFFALKFIETCRAMPQLRFNKAKRLSTFNIQIKWKCNVSSLKHESGTLKNCGFITKGLTQCWEKFWKQEMEKRKRAYFFSLTFTKA